MILCSIRTHCKPTTQYNTAKTLSICEAFRPYGTYLANAEEFSTTNKATSNTCFQVKPNNVKTLG